MLKEFNSLFDLITAFPDEDTCIAYLEERRWCNGVVSPYDSTSKVYKCAGNNYRCKNTGLYFNVKTGTMFHRTSIPLQKWYMAIWLLMSHKKGISSVQLAKDIAVTQKTAWLMLHKIRECFGRENDDTKLEDVVQIDEAFVGGKNKNRHWDKKVAQCQGRSYKDKTPVFGMLQQKGRVVSKVVANTKAKTLQKEILKTVKKGSTIYSDEWNYGNLLKWYNHAFVFHSKGVYANGDVTTNSIESFWAILKRGIIGIYHKVSKKHLQKYVDEFVFRYNIRNISLQDVFNHVLNNSHYRLTYKDLTYAYQKT